MSASSPLTSLTLSIHLLRFPKELASTKEMHTGDIKDNNSRTRIFDIWGDKRMKTLLSCRIP